MALYKRGTIYWSQVFVDGVRHAKSTGTSNRRRAERIDHEFKEELNLIRQGMTEPHPEMIFGELAARFIAEGLSKPYHLDRLKALLPFWGETGIGRITKNLVREYRACRKKAKPKLSDTTINRDLEALRRILFFAVDEGLLTSNPLSRVPMAQERRKPRIVVSVEEEDKLLGAAAPHLRSIIIAGLDSGLRRGELLGQRWEHVDFSRRIISVTHSKTCSGEGREVPMTDRLYAELESRKKEEGLVFTFDGEPIRQIKTAWKAAIRRAKLRYFRFHDLRHAFNTRLMEAGVLADIRRALMGHSSGEDVNAIYTHISAPILRASIQKLERWVAAQRLEAAKKGEAYHAPTTTTDGGGAVPALRAGRDASERPSGEAPAGTGPHLPEGTPRHARRTCRARLSHSNHPDAHAGNK